MRVTVGTDGRARDCVMLHSSGHRGLDATTCTVYVKRARYKPARTKSGAAVESPYVGNLIWLVAG